MNVKVSKLSLEKLIEAPCPCVLIDDSGTPGQLAGSDYLHPDRKTWVAVVVTASQTVEVCEQMPRALEGLISLTGADEFHFTDIYRGSGPFKGIPYKKRLGIFRFMGFIFRNYMFPVIVQTLDPSSLNEMANKVPLPTRVGPFDMRRPSDAALLLLLMRIRWYLRENRRDYPAPAYVILDEGFRPASRSIAIPTFGDVFRNSEVYTANSREFCPLQLADFAAFCIARTQWLLTKKGRSRADMDFMPILAEIRLNTVNLTESAVDLSSWRPEDYEKLIDEDRTRKGLPPYRNS